jgi:hypothetical protein
MKKLADIRTQLASHHYIQNTPGAPPSMAIENAYDMIRQNNAVIDKFSDPFSRLSSDYNQSELAALKRINGELNEAIANSISAGPNADLRPGGSYFKYLGKEMSKVIPLRDKLHMEAQAAEVLNPVQDIHAGASAAQALAGNPNAYGTASVIRTVLNKKAADMGIGSQKKIGPASKVRSKINTAATVGRYTGQPPLVTDAGVDPFSGQDIDPFK